MLNKDWGSKLVCACSEATFGRFSSGYRSGRDTHMSYARCSRDTESESRQDPSRPSQMDWRHSKMAPHTVRENESFCVLFCFIYFTSYSSHTVLTAHCASQHFFALKYLYSYAAEFLMLRKHPNKHHLSVSELVQLNAFTLEIRISFWIPLFFPLSPLSI